MTRAVVVRAFGGPETLEVSAGPARAPGQGEVRVRVRSAAVNFRDVQQRRGLAAGTTLPFTPGSDFSGEVVELGPGVESVTRGQRVVGAALSGAYAQEVVAPAAMVMPVPDGLSFDQAAILPVAGLSASFLCTVAGLRSGATAVVHAAAGGLGCFLSGVLAVAGARIIGLTSTPAKEIVARAAGCEHTVNYRCHDPVPAVKRLTDGVGADIVFDSVGGPNFARSFEMVRNEGTVILCGRSAGEPDLGAVYPQLIAARRNLALRDFYLGTQLLDHLDQIPQRVSALAGHVRDGAITVPITTCALDDVRHAHHVLESGSSSGKIVLHP